MLKKIIALVVTLTTTIHFCHAQMPALSRIPVVDADLLKQTYLHPENDTLYITQFWATWCAVCLAELPNTEALSQKYKNKPVKIQFVSVDFDHTIDHVEATLNKKNIRSKAFLLSPMKMFLDGKLVKAIQDIEPTWADGLPATLIYKNGKKVHFNVGKIEKTALENLILKNL